MDNLVDISRITHLEIGGQDVTAHIRTEPWTLEHDVHLFIQNEVRPGPSMWLERRLAGKANVVCACGFTTGWVTRDQLPTREQLSAEHPSFLGQDTATVYIDEPTREATAAWLTANGIDPADVPLNSAITTHTDAAGTRTIRYTTLLHGEHGRAYLDDNGQAVVEQREVPLIVERP